MPAYTLKEAEDAIRARFRRDGTTHELKYDSKKVVETSNWIYVPCGWIGSAGCIVNRADGYVNFLGSALELDDCFWGHERGVFCDVVDFEFDRQTEVDLVAKLLRKFQHMHANAQGNEPNQPVWYRDSEIAEAIWRQFPFFKRHFVWYAIPEIRSAAGENGLLFKSTLSRV